MRILGIDPGLRSMGWGVIDTQGSRLQYVASGKLNPKQTNLAARLSELFTGLQTVLATYGPDAAAVENTFVSVNGASTLKLGQARGIALLAPSLAGITVGEYAPNVIKKTVVGVGHADKGQVAHMVRMQLPGCDATSHDAIDALGIAICHGIYLSARQMVVEVTP